MVGTRGDQTFSEPLGIASSNPEEERWKNEMGNGSKRIEQANSQRQLPVDKYPGNLTLSTRSYHVKLIMPYKLSLVAVLVEHLLARLARSSTSGCRFGWAMLEVCTAGCWTWP